MIAFTFDPRFAEHDTGPHHPERPERIKAVHAALRQSGLLAAPDPFPDFKMDFGLTPRPTPLLDSIPFQPADEMWIDSIHHPQTVRNIRHVCKIAGGGVLDQGDTPVCAQSYEIARLAVGAVLGCCDAVMSGKYKRAFAAVRPPGHHAEPDRPMGFCLFNNIAIAARYLQRKHNVKRLAIVDFDVHHGNGTQAAFESDPSVYFASLHQDPRTLYPGSGHDWEIGVGEGKGHTLNLTMEPGSDDGAYLRAIETKLLPALDRFQPEVMLLSAGFDAHRADPLAQMGLSDEGFEWITQLLVRCANQHCQGRIVSTLEGGYNLLALGRSVVRHLIGMV